MRDHLSKFANISLSYQEKAIVGILKTINRGFLMNRLLKVALAAFVAIFCLMYAIQNIANLQAAYGFVALMAGMEGHVAYASHVGPSIHSPMLIWTMLWIIIALELLAGLLAAKGAYEMWQARKKSSSEFNDAKGSALLGCGIGVIIWFGIFSAIGGAYFQLWQTQAGGGVLNNAGSFVVQLGVIALLINANDK
jgi:predicted small integral membrane protein